VTALEVPGAGGTTLKMYLLLPVRLILRVGPDGAASVGEILGFGEETLVTHRCAVISMTPFSFMSYQLVRSVAHEPSQNDNTIIVVP